MRVGDIEYAGQHNTGLPFLIDTGAVIGDAVAQTAAGAAGRGADTTPLLGKLVTKESDSVGTVFTRGVIVVPWSGSAVFGQQVVAVDGTGKAKVATGGKQVTVLAVANGLAAIDLG